MADDTLGDELDLKPNGTVRISLSGLHLSLRRPTFGEYRHFREALAEAVDEEDAFKARIEAEALVVAKKRKGADDKPEYSAKQRVSMDLESNRLLVEWACLVLKTLCPKDVPAPEELPAWMTSSSFHTQLIMHWRQVPLARSN